MDLDLSLCGKLFLDEEISDALAVVTSKDDDAVPVLGLCDGAVAVVLLLQVAEDLGEVDHGVHLCQPRHRRHTLLAVTLLHTDVC